ncbi:hypothetical protein E2C01_039555 [Portunus trituberculatus]|uniref:Uncharacterized protein n=1 Tax=Portunus trituberculatus TaxID=210409 RepID=A0A5B7FL24_PORTR|nr:hypothetical protein [Portunus trituberculatus]
MQASLVRISLQEHLAACSPSRERHAEPRATAKVNTFLHNVVRNGRARRGQARRGEAALLTRWQDSLIKRGLLITTMEIMFI